MTPHRQTLTFFAAALLATLATPQPIKAQSLRSFLEVTIPFSFENGSQHLPPGRYTLRTLQDNILQVQGDQDGTNFVVKTDQSLDPARKGRLVFTRYGNHYFLREVWIAGRSTYLLCRKTSAEKQLQQIILAQNKDTAPAEQVAALSASH